MDLARCPDVTGQILRPKSALQACCPFPSQKLPEITVNEQLVETLYEKKNTELSLDEQVGVYSRVLRKGIRRIKLSCNSQDLPRY